MRTSGAPCSNPSDALLAIIRPRVPAMHAETSSTWVRRFAPLIRSGGRALDVAAGGGRHTRLLLDMGLSVTAVDRDVEELRSLVGPACDIREIDLETGDPDGIIAHLGGIYDGIVVTNYLYRPAFSSARGGDWRQGAS